MQVVDILLKAGAHIDQVNDSGLRPSTVLSRNNDSHYILMNHLTLKCLAAQVIQANNISYDHQVPKALEDFIKLH